MISAITKYNYPHAFFLSVAVITLIFGFYPFYINNFDYSSMHWTRILIHGILIIISIVCLWKGFVLWSDKERKREEFEEIRKKRMEQELDINRQKLGESKLNNQIKELTLELNSLKTSNKEQRERKEIEIEKLKKEILEKKQEINKAKDILYDLKKEEISKLPTLSGSSLLPIPISYYSEPTTPPSVSGLNNYSEIALGSTGFKKCPVCGNLISSSATICYFCRTLI